MLELDPHSDTFADKVYGCWLGKNAGGTLGTPVEQLFGEPEPLDLSWYPELRDGGIPNDDLEMQLVWLLALEEVGPGLTARDLSRYWLDHIGYNFDEYGLSKANLRLGLEPPLSGFHNNWFADCMGCPIRSEIWACVAPGAPRIAARYAYQDAICDHAGGESVYGELFNTAVESAAFVVSDVHRLVDIGLSYVRPGSATDAAIRAARDAYANGLDWRQARRQVLDAAPHHVAQYSPINLGFQIIGLLYGADFGDALCTTVNCGFDTDSSGATIGSYLGILRGRSGLPARWTEPLGDTIATNESWGGVRHLAKEMPSMLSELTERLRAAARTVLHTAGALDADGVLRTTEEDLYADESIRALWSASPTVVVFTGPDVDVAVDYVNGPVVVPGRTKSLASVLRNRRRESLTVHCELITPAGWTRPAGQTVVLEPDAETVLDWQVDVPDRSRLDDSNRLYLRAAPVGRPEPPAVPLVLLGASAVRVSGPYGPGGDDLMDVTFPPEEDARAGQWHELGASGNALPLSGVFDEPGVLYVQTFVHAATSQRAWLVVDSNCPVRFWCNDVLVATARRYRGVRPDHRGSSDSSGAVDLRAGWNEIFVKLVRAPGSEPPECHLLLATDDVFRTALTDLGRTRFPWDSPST
jgi:hypothetical protein